MCSRKTYLLAGEVSCERGQLVSTHLTPLPCDVVVDLQQPLSVFCTTLESHGSWWTTTKWPLGWLKHKSFNRTLGQHRTCANLFEANPFVQATDWQMNDDKWIVFLSCFGYWCWDVWKWWKNVSPPFFLFCCCCCCCCCCSVTGRLTASLVRRLSGYG